MDSRVGIDNMNIEQHQKLIDYFKLNKLYKKKNIGSIYVAASFLIFLDIS